MKGPRFDRLDGRFHPAKGGHENDLRLWPARVHRPYQVHAIHLTHTQIRQDHIRFMIFKALESRFGTVGGLHLIPLSGEIIPEH